MRTGTSFKIKIFSSSFLIFLGLTFFASAQSVSFSEITDKFCRNMDALSALYPEKEVKESIGITVEKAFDMKSIYSSGGARAAREKLMKEKESLEKKARLDQSDLDKISKIEKEIKSSDPDGSFRKARGTIEKSISRLEMQLRNLDTSIDPEKGYLVNLTMRHLQVYRAAIAKVQ